MLRLGPRHGPTVLALPALFEEANRTRALIVAILRLLAVHGIGGALPDLPGQNDSPIPTEDARLPDWRAALVAAAHRLPGPLHIVALRGAALLDGDVPAVSRWYLSPLSGEAQRRELERLRIASGGADHGGNRLHPDLLAGLTAARPLTDGRVRVARLADDPREADITFPAAPPWRRSEPEVDSQLAARCAADIASWIGAA